jgi:hypothetical protein
MKQRPGTQLHTPPQPPEFLSKRELVRRLAHLGDITPAAAADRFDEIVFGILKKLRGGKSAAVPGLGRIAGDGASPTQTGGRGK